MQNCYSFTVKKEFINFQSENGLNLTDLSKDMDLNLEKLSKKDSTMSDQANNENALLVT